jgi:hypothetical protein
LLWEAAAGEEQTSSFEIWRKRLHMTASELEDVLHRLHVQEFVNWDETTVEAGSWTTGVERLSEDSLSPRRAQ